MLLQLAAPQLTALHSLCSQAPHTATHKAPPCLLVALSSPQRRTPPSASLPAAKHAHGCTAGSPEAPALLSVGKPSLQSSTAGSQGAGLANDGSLYTNASQCSSTQTAGAQYWQVDLGNTFQLVNISVLNRWGSLQQQGLHGAALMFGTVGQRVAQGATNTFSSLWQHGQPVLVYAATPGRHSCRALGLLTAWRPPAPFKHPSVHLCRDTNAVGNPPFQIFAGNSNVSVPGTYTALDGTACEAYPVAFTQPGQVLTTPCSAVARYVVIKSTGGPLSFCEVEVYGECALSNRPCRSWRRTHKEHRHPEPADIWKAEAVCGCMCCGWQPTHGWGVWKPAPGRIP